MSYNNPTPVAVCLIPIVHNSNDYLLGIKRGIAPCIGEIALPGGYVDEMEYVELAASREVEEEVGLLSTPDDWKIIASRVNKYNKLLNFCILKYKVKYSLIENIFVPNDEVLGIAIIDTCTKIAFPLHEEFAMKYLNNQI